MMLSRFHRARLVVLGMMLGIALLFATQEFIKDTALADRLVKPLSRSDTSGLADAIVVLGAGMTAHCTPNMAGIQRVLLAARLYHERRAPMVVFSGGRPTASGCTVARGMQDLAMRLGVPHDRIRLEERSSSTWENASRSDAVLRALGAKRIVLVTDRPHMRRAVGCFERFGYEIERAGVPVYLSHRDNVDLLLQGLREYASLGLYWWRGYTSSAPAPAALVPKVEPIPSDGTTHDAPTASRAAGDRSGRVVILGASYAKGWSPAPHSGLTFINKGIAGQQSFELLTRLETDVIAERAERVIIWGFINDVFRSSRPEMAVTLSRTRDSFTAMIKRSREAGVQPILATEVLMGPQAGMLEGLKTWAGGVLGKTSYAQYVNGHVMDTNSWLREVAIQNGIPLLDFESALAEGSGQRRREFTSADGSHLTPAAYAALSRYAEQFFRQYVTEQDTDSAVGRQWNPS